MDAAADAYRSAAALDEIGNAREMAALRLATLGEQIDMNVLETRRGEGIAAFKSGDHQRSAEALVRVLAYDTRHSDCWYLVATAYQSLAGTRDLDDNRSHATYWSIDDADRAHLARATQGYRLAIRYRAHDGLTVESLHQLANCLLRRAADGGPGPRTAGGADGAGRWSGDRRSRAGDVDVR